MQWNEQQRKIAESILRYRREDDTYDSKLVMIEVPDVDKSTISKVASALKKNGWIIPPLLPTEVPKSTKGVEQGVSIVGFSQRRAGAILFTIGEVNITLNPKFLYDAYQYYQDIQRLSPDVDDDFSLAIKACVRHCWEHLSHDRVEKIGVTVKEVPE